MSKLWITWEDQPRNRSMAALLDAELYEFNGIKSRFIKYIIYSFQTIRVLIQKRPRVLVVQNPSIVLASLAVLVKPIFNYDLCIDEHNAGIFPLEGKSRVLNFVAKWLAKRSNVVIVTNNELARIIEHWGVRVLVVPDPLPKLESEKTSDGDSDTDEFKIFFVCTWSADEPYMAVIDAAKKLAVEENIRLYVSGNYGNKVAKSDLPECIELTGFLEREVYYDVFGSCDGSIVLTNRENCLNCGAYESVSLEKPGVLAKTKVIQEYFRKGFLYTELDQESIFSAMKELVENHSMYKKEVVELKEELLRSEVLLSQTLKSTFSNLK